MNRFDFDLFVIGGGSGGVRAARVAASMGKKVAIAEEYRYGGTCVIRGCVPKKLLVYASHFHSDFEISRSFGWDVPQPTFHWKKLIENKDREIERLEGLYRRGLDQAGARIYDCRATLAGAHEIQLHDTGDIVTAETIILAVGGTPNPMTALPGHELCISSNEVFHLDALPDEIIIQGGGYIAVEFAGILNGMGSKVTLIYRGEEILRGFDDDLRQLLHAEMETRGITVLCETSIASVEAAEGKKQVTLSTGKTLTGDQVLLATGRLPLTTNLGLDKAGVETAANGAIQVDEYSKTNIDHIWALGDVTDRVALTPVAIHEAMCFIETAYKDNPTRPDHDLIATAVFSQPEIGTIGLTEAEAAEKFAAVNVYRAHFRPMKLTLTQSTEKMLMKLICDAETDRVLGVHILGDGAGEMAQTLAVALKMGATKNDFDRTMAVHPTASEELVTMYQPSYRIEGGKRLN